MQEKNNCEVVVGQALPDLHFMGRKCGFTLIELLVVVLIIGILAAVALPQYQKVVEKSKATQAWAAIYSVAQAQEEYHMANGEYAQHFSDLSVEIPWTGTTAGFSAVSDTRSNDDWSFQIYYLPSSGGVNMGLYMTRLRGKYKGAGFIYFLSMPPDNAHIKKLLCREEQDFGAGYKNYCVKIFKGTHLWTSGSRVYTLP